MTSKDEGVEREAEGGPDRPVGLPLAAEWKLPGDLGRRYAAASGDRNPIHLHALSAKAFGFPRAIAHGMWTKARCMAALEESAERLHGQRTLSPADSAAGQDRLRHG